MNYVKKLHAVTLALLFTLTSLPAAAQTCVSLSSGRLLCYSIRRDPPTPPRPESGVRGLIWEPDYIGPRVGSPTVNPLFGDSLSLIPPGNFDVPVEPECGLTSKPSRRSTPPARRHGRRR